MFTTSAMLVFAAKLVLYSALSIILVSMVGAPPLAMIFELAGKARKKVFLDKLGRQAAAMGAIHALTALPFLVGIWIIFIFKGMPAESAPLIGFPFGEPAHLAASCYVVCLLFSFVYWRTWRKPASLKWPHSLLGLIAFTSGIAGLFCFLVLKRALVMEPMVYALDPSLEFIFFFLASTSSGSQFWPLVAQTVLLALSAAGAMLVIFLWIRRKTEDYGRDYYTWAFKVAARWALVCTLLMAAPLVWLVFHPNTMVQALPLSMMVALGLSGLFLLLACLCWLLIAKSATPLRMKGAAVLAVILLILSLAAEGFALIPTLPV